MSKLRVRGPEYAGFLFSASAILYLLTSGLSNGLASLIYLVIGSGILAASVGFRRQRAAKALDIPFWAAFVLATATAISSFVWIRQPFTLVILVVLLIATIFATVIAHRIGPLAYFMFTLLIALDVGYGSASFFYGLFAWLLAVATFVACNYVYQLVADHRPDFARLKTRVKSGKIDRHHWLRALAIWFPALALAVIGFKINSDLQNAVERSFYDADLVRRDPQQKGDAPQRSLELDLLFMIDTHEAAEIAAFAEMVVQAGQSVDDASVSVPNSIRGFLDSQRPQALDTTPCNAFSIRVLRKNITFRSPCRGVVNAISNKIQTRYAQLENKINGIAEAKAEELKSAKSDAIETIIDEGIVEIRWQHDSARKAVRQTFLIVLIAQYMSYVLLIGALIAGLQITFGRVLYDSDTEDPWFQMKAGRARALRWTISAPITGSGGDDVLDLKNLAKASESKCRYWWVAMDVRRIGEGTEMHLCFPNPMQGTLQRIFSKTFLMTRVDVGASKSKRAGKPYLHIPGDSHLVAIEIAQSVSVAFRMRDLAAFSEGVDLKSIYSTHVSGHFLGLGTFHTVAGGTGYLVLKTEGQHVVANSGGSSPPAALLAWDRHQQFALKQKASLIGIWLNEASITLDPPAGSAIFDQSGQPAALWRRVWRLIRYLFLPF